VASGKRDRALSNPGRVVAERKRGSKGALAFILLAKGIKRLTSPMEAPWSQIPSFLIPCGRNPSLSLTPYPLSKERGRRKGKELSRTNQNANVYIPLILNLTTCGASFM
jgi:hypothetical protein